MGVTRYRLCESNIFGVRAVFGTDVCHIFPQGVLAVVPLIGGVFGVVVTRACTGCWVGPPLCSVVVTAMLGAGRWDWSTPAGKRTLVYSSPGVTHRGHAIL